MLTDELIVRSIRDMGRMMANIILNETEPSYVPPDDPDEFTSADGLYAEAAALASQGLYEKADEGIFEDIDPENPEHLRTALAYFLMVNDREESELAACNYGHDQLRDSMITLADMFGCGGAAELFV